MLFYLPLLPLLSFPMCPTDSMPNWAFCLHSINSDALTLSYLGGGKIRPLLFFLHHPKTAQVIKLKLSDFKDTPLRHILQVKQVRYILSCCHGNKITKGTSHNSGPKKSEKSAICKDIELKFGIETKLGPLESKTNINLQFDVIMTSL